MVLSMGKHIQGKMVPLDFFWNQNPLLDPGAAPFGPDGTVRKYDDAALADEVCMSTIIHCR